MTSNSSTAARDFVQHVASSLKAATASEFEAFYQALALLAWAKLSYVLPLPFDAQVAAVRTRGLVQTLESLLVVATSAQLGETFTDIVKLRDFDLEKINSLISWAEHLAADGALDNLSIDDLMPTGTNTQSTVGVMPAELGNLMVQLGEISSGRTVYTPWDFFGRLATMSSFASGRVYLETPIHSGVPRLIQILTAANVDIRYTDPIIRPLAVDAGFLRKFDISLAFPPLSMRYDKSTIGGDRYGRFPEKTGAGAVLTLRHLLAQTTQRVVVGVPNSLLFSSGAEKSIREHMLEEGIVRSIIAMPEGLLENTPTGFAVLVLDPSGSNQRVRFIDASANQFYEQVSKTKTKLKNLDELVHLALHEIEIPGRGGGDAAASVAVKDLRHNDSNLQVNRHVLPGSKKRLLHQLSATRTVTMRDLATTVRPLSPLIAKKSFDTSIVGCQIFEIGALDLPDFGFISLPGRRLELPSSALQDFSAQFLQPYDIVLIVKGNVGKVGIAPGEVPVSGACRWVVGQSGIVLRLTNFQNFNPSALYLLLRSPVGQELLAGIVSGATTPLIQLRELLSLQVPIPTAAEKRCATEALAREAEIQDRIAQLIRDQAGIAADLWRLE